MGHDGLDKRQAIVLDICQVAERQDESNLRQSTYREHGQYPMSQIRKHLDTWNNAKRAANLPVNHQGEPDTGVDEMLDQVNVMCDIVQDWDKDMARRAGFKEDIEVLEAKLQKCRRQIKRRATHGLNPL